MFNAKVITWICIFVLSSVSCQVDSNCTETKEESTCMVVTSCAFVLKLIDEYKVKEAKNRLCGFHNNTPMVCCPSGNEIVFVNETESLETTRPKPLDTTQHVSTPRPVAKPILVHTSTVVTTSILATTRAPETTLKPGITPKPALASNFGTIADSGLPIPKQPNTRIPPITPVTEEIVTPYPNPFPNRTICGQMGNEDRIVGGDVAGIDEHPWMARIKMSHNNKEAYACAGSLITDRHVLTAAHCVTKKVLSVRLGEYDTSTEQDCIDNNICNDKPVDVAVKEVIPYPGFDAQDITRGDIAILVLAESVNFTDFIQPVCLPTTDYTAAQDYIRDSSYTTVGWGLTEVEDESIVKRKVTLRSVPIETCSTVLNSIKISLPNSSWPNIICAGGRKAQDACQGDSGGPLLRVVRENYNMNWYLYGITSFGTKKCGQEGIPGLYTRVTTFMNWIREQVAQT